MNYRSIMKHMDDLIRTSGSIRNMMAKLAGDRDHCPDQDRAVLECAKALMALDDAYSSLAKVAAFRSKN